MSYYLVLVGTLDNPLYESYLSSSKTSSTSAFASVGAASSASPASTSSPQIPTSFSIFGAARPAPSPNPNATPSASGAATTTQAQLGQSQVGYGAKAGPNGKHVMQLVAHASLDVVEDVQWTNGAMYLKSIDKFHEWTISVWLTPGGVKIVLLHELKNDDGIRLFFQDVWENYVKTLLNPFHELNAPIRSATFDARIRASAKKHL
ncbi:hypothetical protein JCM10212_005928 [Sporobolomyces blumeae]